MNMETEYDELKRELDELKEDYDDLKRKYDTLEDDYFEVSADANELEFELKDAREEIASFKELQESILTTHPDNVWCWLCDAFGISYYDKDAFSEKLAELTCNIFKSNYCAG